MAIASITVPVLLFSETFMPYTIGPVAKFLPQITVSCLLTVMISAPQAIAQQPEITQAIA